MWQIRKSGLSHYLKILLWYLMKLSEVSPRFNCLEKNIKVITKKINICISWTYHRHRRRHHHHLCGIHHIYYIHLDVHSYYCCSQKENLFLKSTKNRYLHLLPVRYLPQSSSPAKHLGHVVSVQLISTIKKLK